MGRQPDLQAALQAMDQLRCELAQSQKASETTKTASTGKNIVLSSGFVMSLLAAGWGYVQDRATEEARTKQLAQDTQAQMQTLAKQLKATDARLAATMALIRQQAIDNVALTTHLAAKMDAISPRSRRVEKPIAVESAEARAAKFRIGDDQ